MADIALSATRQADRERVGAPTNGARTRRGDLAITGSRSPPPRAPTGGSPAREIRALGARDRAPRPAMTSRMPFTACRSRQSVFISEIDATDLIAYSARRNVAAECDGGAGCHGAAPAWRSSPIITVERTARADRGIDESCSVAKRFGVPAARENARACRVASAAAARQPEFQKSSPNGCGKLTRHLKAANMRCLCRETLHIMGVPASPLRLR